VLGDLLKSRSVGGGSRGVSSHAEERKKQEDRQIGPRGDNEVKANSLGEVHGNEDDLGVGLSSHGGQRVESSDAHCSRGSEDIGSSSHESSSVDLSPSSNDLGLSDSLGCWEGEEREERGELGCFIRELD